MRWERFDLTDRWKIRYTTEALKDLEDFNETQQTQIRALIDRFSINPLPKSEGGYGKPLRGRLAGCFKIKLLDAGIRIIYTLKREKGRMLIVLVGMRRDEEVYEIALKRVRAFRNQK